MTKATDVEHVQRPRRRHGSDEQGAAIAARRWLTVNDRPFLTAEWRNLLMVNFVVEPELLAPHVPAGTQIDSHGGATYLSLVAFQFMKTRLLGVRVPLHNTFEEVNLRFYVRRESGGESRRAVVFLREVVPRRAIALLARAIYNEPYVARPMCHEVSGMPPGVEYGWRHEGRWHLVAGQAHGAGALPAEHYWGYTRQRDGRTLEYRVEHPRWTVWAAALSKFPPLASLCGETLAAGLIEPASVFIADGSPVSVWRGVHLGQPEARQ